MSKSQRKKNTRVRPPTKATVKPPLDPLRTGMPALDSITDVDEFTRGWGKEVFRIIHTNEVDAYEPIPPKPNRNKRI